MGGVYQDTQPPPAQEIPHRLRDPHAGQKQQAAALLWKRYQAGHRRCTGYQSRQAGANRKKQKQGKYKRKKRY